MINCDPGVLWAAYKLTRQVSLSESVFSKVTWTPCGGADCRRQCTQARSRTRGDPLHAFRSPIRAYDVDDGFTMFIGPAPNADLLELGVVSGAEGPVIVHAMPARQRFLE